VFSIGVSDALVDGDTITITATNNVFVASGTLSCVSSGVGLSAATTPTATSLVMHAPSSGITTGSKVFKCSGSLAANLAVGTSTTFTAVSTKSTTISVASAGYTTVVSAPLVWANSVPVAITGSLVDGKVPDAVTFKIGFPTALISGDTVTITSTRAIWISTATPTCTEGAVGIDVSAVTTSTTVLVMTAPQGGIAVSSAISPTSFTCTGGLAANGPAGTSYTFTAVSTKSPVTVAQSAAITIGTSSLVFTSVVVSSLTALDVAATITFVFDVTDALAAGETLTITSDKNIWAKNAVQHCFSTKHVLSAVTSGLNTLVVSHTGGIPQGPLTLTCDNGLAANSAYTTAVGFTAYSAQSKTPVTHAGYTIKSIAPTASPTSSPTPTPTWAPTATPTSAPTIDGPATAGLVIGSIALAILVVLAIVLGALMVFLAKQMHQTHGHAISAHQKSQRNKEQIHANHQSMMMKSAGGPNSEVKKTHAEVEMVELDVEQAGIPAAVLPPVVPDEGDARAAE
jgi:hypothetical protein